MSIKSPLTSLVDVIRQAVDSAQRYGVTLRKNEAATRAVLIDPILRALGWDIANTSMVEVEKVLNNTRVDYALYDGNGDVGVVVEGKALDKVLGDGQVPTLLAYAFQHGAMYSSPTALSGSTIPTFNPATSRR
jgi:predicted type IV restriction endonuclease